MCVVDAGGSVVASSGDITRPFYLRSAAKPFQAYVSQSLGAGLSQLELAMACASHRGFPVQVALVRSMLGKADLDETSLRCPADWPLGAEAAETLVRSGAHSKRSLWHNCSGKHAGFLRACVAQGWPTDSYLSPDHPLQQAVIQYVSGAGDFDVEPVGVDGCGAPVLRTSALAMATLFSRLANDDRLVEVRTAMQRYPALVGVNGSGDTEIAIAIGGVAKGGAAGCVGVAVEGRLGLAVKSWDGSHTIASSVAANALDQIGVLNATSRKALSAFMTPPVLGGGREVGQIETRLELA
jgi:L-asparaginase II